MFCAILFSQITSMILMSTSCALICYDFILCPPRFSSLLNLFENTYNIIKRTIIIVLQKLIEYSRFLLWHVPSILPWKIGKVQKDSLVKQTSLIHSEVLLALFYNIIFRSNVKSLKTLFSSSSIYAGKLRETFQRRNFWINFYSNQ